MGRDLDAFAGQADALADWLDGLAGDDATRPSVLDGWDVRTLIGHCVLIRRGLARVLATRSGEPAVPAAEYVRRYRTDVAAIAASTGQDP